MRQVLLVTTAALLASSAMAADLPQAYKAPAAPIAPPAWTGFYLGGQFGYQYDTGSAGLSTAGVIDRLDVAPAGGWTLGGRAGYDYDFGGFVLGVVTEINWSNASASSSGSGNGIALAPVGNNLFAVSTLTDSGNLSYKSDWWGATNARIGIPVFGAAALPYVVGGLAYGERNLSYTGTTSAFGLSTTLNLTSSDTALGWDAGAGIEARINRNWSTFVEGKYVNLGTLSATSTSGVNISKDFNFGSVEGGVNYRF